MKKLVVILVILGIAGLGYWRIQEKKNLKQSPTTQEIQMKEGIPVETQKVGRGTIDVKLSVYGNLKGNAEVPIFPKVGGRIVSLHVDNGDRVRAGQLLAQLETKEIQDNVNQAIAGVNAAREQYALVLKGARPQELTQVQNLVDQAEQAYKVAADNMERMNKLLASGVVSQQQYDMAKIQYDGARTGFENAKQQLSIVKTGAREEEKKMARENKNRAEAGLSFAQEQIKNASLTSPVSGVVSTRYFDVGTLVGPSMQIPMMTIVDDSAFFLNADISETDLAVAKVGQSVDLSIDAIPGKTFKGKIIEINPAASMGTRTYTLRIKMLERDPAMKSGMFCRGDVVVNSVQNVIIAPKDALIKNEDGSYKVIVVENEKAVVKEVKVGVINTKHVEVTDGLKEGEKLVVVGSSTLKDGDKVKDTGSAKAVPSAE